uniref:Histone H2A n=1 Tax=Prolemur simus TaxID=1328070 RepID=A0A8C8ZEZ1_PROSS
MKILQRADYLENSGNDEERNEFKKEFRAGRSGSQYLTTEEFELAGSALKDLKVKCITPCHLQLAICGDEELDYVIKATVAGGGVIPHIHKSLIEKKGQQKTV